MAITIFNPRYFNKKKNTADVKRFVWSHGYWNLKVGEIKKFPDEVGEAMLRLMEFLIEVTPKNLKKIKAEAEVKEFGCDQCDFETSLKIALINHQKTHTKEESAELEGIATATPTGTFKRKQTTKELSIEEQEGIPKGEGIDKDGVAWVGMGVEDEQDSAFVPRMK